MSEITFEPQQKSALVDKLQRYFEDELSTELGQFDAEFLLDFISKEMGGTFYNQGIRDARAVFEARVQSIDEDLYAIEKPDWVRLEWSFSFKIKLSCICYHLV